MRRVFSILLLAGFTAVVLGACSGVGGGVRTSVYHHGYYGHGGWWGYRPYIDRRPIIIPPDRGDDAVNLPVYPDSGGGGFEAMPLPAEPMMDFDMGMPDMMDFGM